MHTMEGIGAPAKCWSCGKELADGQPFCASCGKVQPPMDADYFAVFGLPVKLGLDVKGLEKQFYSLSRKLHPDVHARASQQEQDWSLAQASRLNDAYRTLKSPLERTKYLLRIEGVQLEDAGESGNRNSKVPPDLLEEVFELNMQLDELRMGDDSPQLRKDLETAKGQFASQLSDVDAQIQGAWSQWDAGDEAGKASAKESMIALLQRRSYLNNLVRDVEETLGGS
jgi:molecular chaperone HscB